MTLKQHGTVSGTLQSSISRAFIAAVESGRDIETAAREMLQSCAEAGIRPTAPMHHNVLMRLDRKGPPEAVISWFARMRHDGIMPNTAACNIAMKCYAATGNPSSAVQLLTSMMRQRGTPAARSPQLPPPDEVSFNTVISALARTLQPEKAEVRALECQETRE